jgi:hypothetical protein
LNNRSKQSSSPTRSQHETLQIIPRPSSPFSSHFCAAARAARPKPPAPQANRFAATIAPAERFEIDGVLVEQHGKKRAAAAAR